MSLLDNDNILMKNTNVENWGFPKENELIEVKNKYDFNKCYKWDNPYLFDKYQYIDSNRYTDSYIPRGVTMLLTKNDDGSHEAYPGLLLTHMYKDFDNTGKIIKVPLTMEAFLCKICANCEDYLVTETYKILRFLKENIEYIEIYIKLINYENLNHISMDFHKNQSYYLADKSGKLVFIPETFNSADNFIDFIKTCKSKNVDFYDQNEYINKFNAL